MDEPRQTPDDLMSELRQLGQNLKAVLQAGWESDERKKAQAELESALGEAAAALHGAGKEFIESPAGQKLRAEVEDLGQKLRRAEVREKAQAELLEALHKVNAELARLAARWQSPAGPQNEDRAA
ncbi:MAG: hypothetical protein AB1449_13240 [Chloroflexota bacterium]